MTEGRAELRRLLAAPPMLVAPGGYDGITARLIEQAGFGAVYMTGAGTAASFGLPDYGLLSMTEMVDNAARMARATRLPVIADADTGYGTELNVVRTVQEHERAGTAAIHIEDQVSPKRCGHLDGKELVGREEFLAKIRAAVATRRTPTSWSSPARTRAPWRAWTRRWRAPTWRSRPAPTSPSWRGRKAWRRCALVPAARGGPLPAQRGLGRQARRRSAWTTPRPWATAWRSCPGLLLKTVYGACDAALAALRETRRHPTPLFDASVRDGFRRFGADEWDALRTRFRDAAE